MPLTDENRRRARSRTEVIPDTPVHSQDVMSQWQAFDALPSAFDLSLLGPVPLELDPAWLRSCTDQVDRRVRYFLIGDWHRPVGYAPFIVHPSALSFCIGEMTMFSVSIVRHAMQGSPLPENRPLLVGLFEPLRAAVGNRGAVFLEGVQVDSPLGKLLASPPKSISDYFHVVPYGPTYARRLIELPEGAQFEDYLLTLGSNTQNDVRRTRRNFSAKAKAPVKLCLYSHPDQAAALASALEQVSHKTYQYHLLGLGLQNTPEQVEQLRAAAVGGWLRAYVLWIGDAPVAFKLGYHDGRTFFSHHAGYDPAIAKLQPGIYLHTEVMADLLANGIRRFDFLAGDSVYKRRMSNTFREERHYYLIPCGWPGTVYTRTLIAVNSISEVIGRWLEESGWKERIKRRVRASAVKRSAAKR